METTPQHPAPTLTITNRNGRVPARTGPVYIVAEIDASPDVWLFVNSPAGVDYFVEFQEYFTVNADLYTDVPVLVRRYHEDLDCGYEDDGWRFEETYPNLGTYMVDVLRKQGITPKVVADPAKRFGHPEYRIPLYPDTCTLCVRNPAVPLGPQNTYRPVSIMVESQQTRAYYECDHGHRWSRGYTATVLK